MRPRAQNVDAPGTVIRMVDRFCGLIGLEAVLVSVECRMENSSTVISRQALYDLVWTKPTSHISKAYGVKPAVLLKACKVSIRPKGGR